ncbi:hypothetical protein K501DRAFT_49462 [Backusella circina FSU 941]|nr:hypothetical protein K501DRAFT_338895 [Backusella circina FSU 941]KAI8876689.1 hypothetical protein K501DRAFT_49462 [Backusella circina FSU 941]
MNDQENIIQRTTELPRSNITEVKQSRHVSASKIITSPKKSGGLKDAANKDNVRVEKLVDAKTLHRTRITNQTKSDIAVYNEEKKTIVQKKKSKEDIVKTKDEEKAKEEEGEGIDSEKITPEIKQLNQVISLKTDSLDSKKLTKKHLDQAIKDTQHDIDSHKTLTAREKEAVQDLRQQVDELEATDKELDEMILSLDQIGSSYELQRQEKQQVIDALLNTLSEIKYEISELRGEP